MSHLSVEKGNFDKVILFSDVSHVQISNSDFKHTLAHQQVVIFKRSTAGADAGLRGKLEMDTVKYEPDTNTA